MYKIKEIIEALLYFADSQEMRTKIVKACYLLESEYFDKTGKRLTSMEYKHWNYGPYSADVVNVAEQDKNIRHDSRLSIRGNPYVLYKLETSPDLTSKFDSFTLSLIKKWGQAMKKNSLDQLKKIAYEDKNFKRAAKKQTIHFESDFLKKKELIKKRVKAKFGSYKLTKEELEGLSKTHNESLVNCSMKMLAESDEYTC